MEISNVKLEDSFIKGNCASGDVNSGDVSADVGCKNGKGINLAAPEFKQISTKVSILLAPQLTLAIILKQSQKWLKEKDWPLLIAQKR